MTEKALQQISNSWDEHEKMREAARRYIASPSSCPYCGSDNITGDDRDGDDEVIQEVTCDDCGLGWTDVYTLTGVILGGVEYNKEELT